MRSTKHILSNETKIYGITLVVLIAALILLENWSSARVYLKNIEVFFGIDSWNWKLSLITLIIGFLIGLGVSNRKQ